MITLKQLQTDPNEKPLDRFPVANGGMTAIFRTVACVGDSLSSGEFEAEGDDGKRTYHDMFEYSWGQFIGRAAGCKVYNFSRGGMTANEYLNSYANIKGFWDPEKAAQAYIIALGVNDLVGCKGEAGHKEDVNLDKPEDSKNTLCGSIGRIILRYKAIAPHAKFFLVTMPNHGGAWGEAFDTCAREQARAMHELAELFPNAYVLDMYENGPVYDAEFKKNYLLLGHMNAAGYCLTAEMYMTYIDWIIRHNLQDFAQVGLINTPWYMPGLDKNDKS